MEIAACWTHSQMLLYLLPQGDFPVQLKVSFGPPPSLMADDSSLTVYSDGSLQGQVLMGAVVLG